MIKKRSLINFLRCLSLLLIPTAILAQNRNFQMATWGKNPLSRASDRPVDADLGFFNEGDVQLGTPSILGYYHWNTADPRYKSVADVVKENGYVFDQIAAVVVDEPYLHAAGGGPTNAAWQSPCRDSGGQTSQRSQRILSAYQSLQAAAQWLHQNAPKVRFWIDFSEPEVQWMMDSVRGCTLTLNGPFVDVVSMDKYRKPFAGPCRITFPNEAPCVQPYYEWLVNHRGSNSQQLALVPGTFVTFREGVQRVDPQSQANILAEYFNYATNMNQSCKLPVRGGVTTGRFDGCMVWVVIGFPSNVFSEPGGPTWCGELETVVTQQTPCPVKGATKPIHAVWLGQFSKTLTPPASPPGAAHRAAPSIFVDGVPTAWFIPVRLYLKPN